MRREDPTEQLSLGSPCIQFCPSLPAVLDPALCPLPSFAAPICSLTVPTRQCYALWSFRDCHTHPQSTEDRTKHWALHKQMTPLSQQVRVCVITFSWPSPNGYPLWDSEYGVSHFKGCYEAPSWLLMSCEPARPPTTSLVLPSGLRDSSPHSSEVAEQVKHVRGSG